MNAAEARKIAHAAYDAKIGVTAEMNETTRLIGQAAERGEFSAEFLFMQRKGELVKILVDRFRSLGYACNWGFSERDKMHVVTLHWT